jgi:ring-1,2-phenylacetyl-CoA epoxidase subunit PaaC
VLEQDIATTNTTLDLVGQARSFYQYAARLINELQPPLSTGWRGAGGEVSEDSLAYLRSEREFKNCLLVEQPNGDWAQTILRQFLFSGYQYYLYQYLQENKDETLRAIAGKSLKEVSYHLRWSSEWVIRLGDGTEESRNRMLRAIDERWRYTGEMFIPAPYETELGIDLNGIKEKWKEKVNTVLAEASLHIPGEGIYMQKGGKTGVHTEHLGFILTELQYMQRAYPGSEW